MENVSIIIPTHFRNDSLRSAVRSALAQTYEPSEIIIVDDSGEKHAAPVSEEFAGNSLVTYYPLEENLGSMAAREKGVDLAEGDYIQFLDDDDKLHPEKIKRQIELITNNHYGVVYCGLTLENGGTFQPQEHVQGDILESALSFNTWPCCIVTMLIDRSVYETIRPVTNKGEDSRMKIKLAQETTFGYIETPLVTVGTDTNETLGGTQWLVEGYEKNIELFSNLYEKHPRSYKNARKELAIMRARVSRQEELSNSWWSWEAIRESFRAAFYAQDERIKNIGLALATLGGKPGLRFGEMIVRHLK